MEYLMNPEVRDRIYARAEEALRFEVTQFDICSRCGNPIYYGPRTEKTFRKNDVSSYDHIWRHVDTEHRKCGIGIPKANPRSQKKHAL
jgi:hypothetical protein